MKTSVMVSSKSVIAAMPLSVTIPTGLITSPSRKPYPGLVILKSLTSNSVEPIPVTEVGPTIKLTSKFSPTSVVAPSPGLETPTNSRFSYDGCGTEIVGLVYPVPPELTVKERVPPAPTVAVTSAP